MLISYIKLGHDQLFSSSLFTYHPIIQYYLAWDADSICK
jgi:hypothetical protein